MKRWLLVIGMLVSSVGILGSCGSLPTKTADTLPPAAKSYPEVKLAKIFETAIQGHAGESGFILLRKGDRALQERLYFADLAEHTIDAQYYIWNSDKSGKLLAQRLIQAGDRGVSVRIILDDFSIGDRNEQMLAVDSHPNIQIRIYNPFVSRSRAGKWLNFAFDFDRLNRRMHNKTYTVDGVAAIVGGRNIGDEYFDQHEHLNFKDLDLLTVGPAVEAVSKSFEEYWDSPWAIPIGQLVTADPGQGDKGYLERLLDENRTELSQVSLPEEADSPESHFNQAVNELTWAPATFIYDHPGGEDKEAYSEGPKRVAGHLLELAQNSVSDILIESAYFVLGEPALELAGRLRDRGVRIRALTNSMASNDVLPNHASYAMVREKMLAHGVELYELRPDAPSCLQTIGAGAACDEERFLGLHAKAAVFDRQTVYVGSCNLNLRSAYLNSEVGMFVDSSTLAETLIGQIELDMKRENSWQPMLKDNQVIWVTEMNGQEKTSQHEPQTSFFERVKEGILTLVPGALYY